MGFLGGLIVVACAWLCGRALLPSRKVLERSLWEEQCLAYVIGAGVLPLAAMAVTFIGLPFNTGVAWLLLLAAGAAGVMRIRKERATDQTLAPENPGKRVGILLAVLGGAAVFGTLAFPLNEFDPIIHFAFKGKILYFTGNPLDETFTNVSGVFARVHTHPNYPLGIPFLEAFAAHAGFGWSDRWVQLPVAFWTLCLPALAAFALRPRGKRAATAAAILVACTPVLYVRFPANIGAGDMGVPSVTNLAERIGTVMETAGLHGRVILGGAADLPLAAMIAAGLALFLRGRKFAPLHTAVLTGLVLAAGVLMKNEGLGLGPSVLLAAALGLPARSLPDWKRIGLAIAVFAVAVSPWLMHRANLPAIDENYGDLLTWERIDAFLTHVEPPSSPTTGANLDVDNPQVSRPKLILDFYWKEFTNILSFGLLWLLFWLSLPVGRGFRDPEARTATLFVLGALLLYALIMLVTTWYLYQLRFTGIPERLMIHLVVPVAMVVGYRLGPRSEEAPAPTIEG